MWRTFPKFVLGFIAVSAPATAHVFTKAEVTSLGNLSKWAFLLCFAGVGLNFDLRRMAAAASARRWWRRSVWSWWRRARSAWCC